MTAETTRTSSTGSSTKSEPNVTDRLAEAGDSIGTTLGSAAENVRGLAASTADRVPEAAATARDMLAEADRQMRGGSDEMLAAGATLSTGIAVGLLVGGAHRMLVALAMVPAVAMGMTLLERSSTRTRGRTSRA
jgi:hypothetical protein